ncbi:hypothetical protein [Aliarcobacter butzleri]|uniref:Uncharacterized protein n=1 Tax=Aliarcobacter butzleri TaxID=28197 RepID=A0AAP4PIF3_9BACT|nr:hypothetical protein [Aliarcobacter butzleri]MCT7548648.1 hypothetical protein [Aliarcobacter butzleri]MCT7554709.1 hypothetical protein [Aliarcobacter butzleri]MCT7630902.1 hypothetical protein [Aliarcobacter butzleri]MCT7646554.1 hypothetical protein [Aliarcobacter butzleri]MDN5061501.1 hypothetical protein [Aliarcobacter butzleri]
MSEYIVRTKEIEPIIKPEEESYFEKVNEIENVFENVIRKFGSKFPYDDFEKSKLEAYEYGTYIQCNDFIKKIPIEIQSYFTIEEIEEYV